MAEMKHLYTGNLPLHAVFYNAFFSSAKRATIAEMIIKANPQSVLMTNHDGRTPLHTTCTQHCNYEPVVALLEAAPQIAKWTDTNNELPLHLACRSQKTPNKSIQALFTAFPEGIFYKNGQGMTPLEIAKASRITEQRKISRLALLTSLQAQQIQVKMKNIPGIIHHKLESNSKRGANTFENLQEFDHFVHQGPKRKRIHLNDNWTNQDCYIGKTYQRYDASHHYSHMTENIVEKKPYFPIRSEMSVSSHSSGKKYHDFHVRYAMAQQVYPDCSSQKLFHEKHSIILRKMNQFKNIGQIGLKRKDTRPGYVKAEESCAIALVSLRNQN